MNSGAADKTPRKTPLNPADYFFYAHHCMMQRRREGGNIAFMIMELDGHIAPERLREAIRHGFVAHPVLMSPLRLTWTTRRPVWRVPNDLAKAAEVAAQKAHVYDDLRDADDWRSRLERLCQDRYVAGWDLEAGPQVSVEHYALPEGRTRLCLRWPHLLMDAGGAMCFLAELERLGGVAAERMAEEAARLPDYLRRDHETNLPLAGQPFARRLRLLRESFSVQVRHKRFDVKTMFAEPPAPYRDQRYIHRGWSAAEFAELQAIAKRCTPPGPALYARYLAVCVLRALHRVFTDLGVASDAYLITMPMSLADLGAPDAKRPARPVPGNYLVSPTLWGRRAIIDDKRALGDELFDQLKRYNEEEVPLKQWAMVWAAAISQAWFYQWLMRLPLGLEALSSGYSFYGEIPHPPRSLCGAEITNLWGGGPLPTPPGWNPVFSKFEDRLNLSLTYARPAISDELAERFVALIEAEAFERSE